MKFKLLVIIYKKEKLESSAYAKVKSIKDHPEVDCTTETKLVISFEYRCAKKESKIEVR